LPVAQQFFVQIAGQDEDGVTGVGAEHHLGLAERVRAARQDLGLQAGRELGDDLPEVPGVADDADQA
jgi:hypothetical protein